MVLFGLVLVFCAVKRNDIFMFLLLPQPVSLML